MAAEELDSLHRKFADCTTIAFADVSTQMVLVSNSASELDRGALDALCAEASILLGAKGKPGFATSTPSSAIRKTANETIVFVRSEAEANDILIGVCTHAIETGKFIPEALVCLNKIGLD